MMDVVKYGTIKRLTFFKINWPYGISFTVAMYTYPLANMNSGMWKV